MSASSLDACNLDCNGERFEAYRTAHFVVLAATGPVTFSLAGVVSGDGHRFAGRPLAVVTAWNPGVARPGQEANERANARLEARLRRDGFAYLPAVGRSPDGSHEEPSFAVIGIDAEEARGLAEDFGQAAIFYWSGNGARLVWCRGEPPAES